mmetsp:Transcript_33241/g.53899  ORF Transcript_33241/g.53899 Transcript_33241/m.53899 type:complete len:292 (-) Transcript_33241:647-1522(-)
MECRKRNGHEEMITFHQVAVNATWNVFTASSSLGESPHDLQAFVDEIQVAINARAAKDLRPFQVLVSNVACGGSSHGFTLIQARLETGELIPRRPALEYEEVSNKRKKERVLCEGEAEVLLGHFDAVGTPLILMRGPVAFADLFMQCFTMKFDCCVAALVLRPQVLQELALRWAFLSPLEGKVRVQCVDLSGTHSTFATVPVQHIRGMHSAMQNVSALAGSLEWPVHERLELDVLVNSTLTLVSTPVATVHIDGRLKINDAAHACDVLMSLLQHVGSGSQTHIQTAHLRDR